MPKTGVAYAGILGYYKPYEVKEYVQQHLNSSLITGKSYYVSFYVSRVERFTMAIKNIGAYFSVTQPTVVGNTYLSATPQIENQTNFLSDTTGWTKIEGYFTAQGGEEYITIGNFNSNADTDTLFIGTNNPLPSNPDGAYYYIDSVSLYDSLTYVTGLDELKKEGQLNLYPNPTNGSVRVSSKFSVEKIELLSITGQVLLSETVDAKEHQLQLQDFAEGIYFVKCTYANGMSVTKKLIKQ